MTFLLKTKEQGLSFVPLNLSTMHLLLITDASFANVEGLRSQLGYFIAMIDDTGQANIIHFDSNKCKRISRSVMAAEVHDIVLGFEFAFVIK